MQMKKDKKSVQFMRRKLYYTFNCRNPKLFRALAARPLFGMDTAFCRTMTHMENNDSYN